MPALAAVPARSLTARSLGRAASRPQRAKLATAASAAPVPSRSVAARSSAAWAEGCADIDRIYSKQWDVRSL